MNNIEAIEWIENIKEKYIRGGDEEFDEKRKTALEMAIKALEQEPKIGHWIDTDEWRETVDGFEQWGYFRKCSKCGYVFKFLEIDNFCPNCGARMESEE